ncbi:MAG: GNAT family N-acetyltransferase [Salinivirgaceae bacterium]|jgi:GNAT superfamily N-acetyltransferase|nr:GNAT family N-acetyltransferase [Salinivirgaceae bacterium]
MIYSIFKATESDYPQILELFREFAAFENLESQMTNNLEQMLEEKEFFNWYVVKTNNNTIIGYATYFYTYFTWSGKSIYMEDLYIKEKYRGEGLGTKLINTQIERFAIANLLNRLRSCKVFILFVSLKMRKPTIPRSGLYLSKAPLHFVRIAQLR